MSYIIRQIVRASANSEKQWKSSQNHPLIRCISDSQLEITFQDDPIWSEHTFLVHEKMLDEEDYHDLKAKISVVQKDATEIQSNLSMNKMLPTIQEDHDVVAEGKVQSHQHDVSFSKHGEIMLDNESDVSIDSLLDYVVIVEEEKPNRTTERRRSQDKFDEASIFDGLSVLTKDDKRNPFDMMFQTMVEDSRKVLDNALNNIMDNTDFTDEPFSLSCDSVGPLCVIEAFEALKDGMKSEDTDIIDISNEKPASGQAEKKIDQDNETERGEDTFIDFGALPAADNNNHDAVDENLDAIEEARTDILLERDDVCTSSVSGSLAHREEQLAGKPVSFKIVREHKKEHVGLVLRKAASGTGMIVSSIDVRSKFNTTGLNAGMVIVAINNHPCPDTVVETSSRMKETTGELVISAISTQIFSVESNPATLASFSKNPIQVSRKNDGVPVSESICTLRNEDEERNVEDSSPVKTATPQDDSNGPGSMKETGSLLGFWSNFTSKLKSKFKHDKAVKGTDNDNGSRDIDGTATTSKSNHDKAAKGTDNDSGSRDTETATGCSESSLASSSVGERKDIKIFQIQRLNWWDPIGVKMQTGKGGIVVSEIEMDSPFRFTDLKVGMRVVEINGVPCPNSLLVTTNLLAGATDSIELVVTNEVRSLRNSHQPLIFYSEF